MSGPRKGLNPGTFRTKQGATSRHLWIRDDLWTLLGDKAAREARSKRSVFEAALYYYLGGENLPIPHPDDPRFADTNQKREKADHIRHAEVSHLDIENREAIDRARRSEETDDPPNPWNQ